MSWSPVISHPIIKNLVISSMSIVFFQSHKIIVFIKFTLQSIHIESEYGVLLFKTCYKMTKTGLTECLEQTA